MRGGRPAVCFDDARRAFSRKRRGLQWKFSICRVMKNGIIIPHRSECPVVVAHCVPVCAPLILALVRHERTQGKLELCHVTRQLQLSCLPEGFRNGRMQNERLNHILHQHDHPASQPHIRRCQQVKIGPNNSPPLVGIRGIPQTEDIRFDKIQLLHQVFHVRTRSSAHPRHDIR